MDKKQCERMFEQMQPPEAVVQRLQQRIHAEEAASLAEQQPNRSIQTLHTTTAPPPQNAFAVLGRNSLAAWLQPSFC